jgi:hypothetical protein
MPKVADTDVDTRPLVLMVRLHKQNIAAGLCILWLGTSHASVYHLFSVGYMERCFRPPISNTPNFLHASTIVANPSLKSYVVHEINSH